VTAYVEKRNANHNPPRDEPEAGPNDNTYNFRNFGYFFGQATISHRTVNETAIVVDHINRDLLGIEHILSGADHLLFVFGLLLIVASPWMLVKTVTAFTIAHSITLAAATLGYVRPPAAPIEAGIAMSILFLGVEIVRAYRGGTSFTIRHPWVVAFLFGLLHGFGFAGALTAAGLPPAAVPWRWCRSTSASKSASSPLSR
jgi:hypothetical protein